MTKDEVMSSSLWDSTSSPWPTTNGQSLHSQNFDGRMQQILLHLSQIQEELEQAHREISECKEMLDEQSVDKDLLAIDLDHHKETLVEVLRDLSDKEHVVSAQGFLLNCAREEIQTLTTANAEKDRTICDLKTQLEQRNVETIEGGCDIRKKRKLNP